MEGYEPEATTAVNTDFLEGQIRGIPSRGLTQETCKRWQYMVGHDRFDQPVHIANYRDEKGNKTHQKLRDKSKKFPTLGNAKNPPLYGMHLWGRGGKSLTITEGELDALSVYQAMPKYAVVSLPSGAQSAVKAIQTNWDYVTSFEKVVLMFDMDDPGQKAAEEVAAILPPGKAHVAKLQHKDANEVLLKEGSGALVSAFWGATPWKPDGIISGAEITKESLKQAVSQGYSTRYPMLNQKLGGLRKRELILLSAGSGIGKSTFARELAYGLHQDHGLTIGNVFLEESTEKTAQGYIAIHNDIPLGKLRSNPEALPEDQWDKTIQEVIHSRMFFYDHFGSLDSERLLQKLRYMAVVCQCDFIVLDHISIVVSGQEASNEGERRDIDRLMTKLRSLVEETGVGIIAIVHLRQPEGKPHEEGGRVTLSQLRGSGSLKQLSDAVVALERDQQGQEANRSTIRVLKNRETGDVGEADTLDYNKETGRLLVTEDPFA